MVFFKKVELRCVTDKYGGQQRGLFAAEHIRKDEKIWYCECGERDDSYTRSQLLDIIKKHPHLDYFVRSFSYMIDDDLYGLPVTYLEQKNNDECAYFNHSCTPNVGFAECDSIGDKVIACRDINPGDELTYHYGFLETEASLIYGMECKCSAANCSGRLTFDYYRDPTFVQAYFKYMTPYLKKKAADALARWYSRKCYTRRYLPRLDLSKFKPQMTNAIMDLPSNSNKKLNSECDETINSSDIDSPILSTTPRSTTASSSSPVSMNNDNSDDDASDVDIPEVEDWELGLCSLFELKKDELVASFKSVEDLIDRKHFLRGANSEVEANCYVVDKDVFAKYDIPSETELTIYYHGILL